MRLVSWDGGASAQLKYVAASAPDTKTAVALGAFHAHDHSPVVDQRAIARLSAVDDGDLRLTRWPECRHQGLRFSFSSNASTHPSMKSPRRKSLFSPNGVDKVNWSLQ